jgi:hypothetical protein
MSLLRHTPFALAKIKELLAGHQVWSALTCQRFPELPNAPAALPPQTAVSAGSPARQPRWGARLWLTGTLLFLFWRLRLQLRRSLSKKGSHPESRRLSAMCCGRAALTVCSLSLGSRHPIKSKPAQRATEPSHRTQSDRDKVITPTA